MASQIIASIHDALENLKKVWDGNGEFENELCLRPTMHKLRGLRTFLLCLKKTDSIEDSSVVGSQLESLLNRLGDFVEKMKENDLHEYLFDIESLVEELDKWYTSLQASDSPVAGEVEDIFNSVLENLEDFLSLHIAYVGDVVAPLEALKVSITFWRNFLHFATFLGTDKQPEFQDLMMNMEGLAFSAAHFTLHFISGCHYNIRVFFEYQRNSMVNLKNGDVYRSPEYLETIEDIHSPDSYETFYDRVKFAASALLFRINPLDNSCLYESYTRALASMKSSRESYVVTNLDIDESIAILLSILWEVLQFHTAPASSLKYELHKVYEELRYLRALLKKHPNKFHGDVGEVARAAIFDAGVIISSIYDKTNAIGHEVEEFLGNIKIIKAEVEEQAVTFLKTDSERIFDVREEEPDVPQEVTSAPTDQVISSSSIPSANDFVGFEAEKREIIDRLTRGSKKLQVVAIVGMPGLGKTTLATKVYNEVQRHFHVRAWCSISQDFNKKKVFLDLLNQISVSKSDYSAMDEDDLAQELRRSLLQRRYLIYIDDVWDMEAYQCFKLSFPDDSGGRILLTSRIGSVAKLDHEPHFLRQLTFNESLELLQMKALHGKGWPDKSLYHTAVKIAENCKGLPLTIVIVAGLLATMKKEVWEEVLESLTSGIISSTDQCERTIELSYKHLPDHLKPCLLSFGAFPEDQEISVKRLIWLWIAEGFVGKEDVAADYLKDLIGMSLVMESHKRNGGGIKTCRIHDLLLDFCLRKANEGNALHLLNGKEEALHVEDSYNLRRLCVHSKMEVFMESKLFCPNLRSLSFFGVKRCDEATDISFIYRIFKLLRVFNMEKVCISSDFPRAIGALVQLRYLAITISFDIHPSVGNLSQLETFILHTLYGLLVTMPDTFWNLRKLRHLLLNYMEYNEEDIGGIVLPVDSSCKFLEVESLSGLQSKHWSIMENHLRNFPNTRRLKFWLNEFGNDSADGRKIMSFSFLSRLESLTLAFLYNSTEFEFVFPKNVKKLHLSYCYLSWEKISSIAQLPNLEVLKLLDGCFIGEEWKMEEGEFSKLRFLKLEGLGIIKWIGCDDQFPNLEKLVVKGCRALEEVPESLESIDSLEMIEVINCSDRVACLFETVADNLKYRGNSVLQLQVRPTKKHELGSADEEDKNSASNEGSASEEDN